MRVARLTLAAALAATTVAFAGYSSPAPAAAGVIPGSACKVIGDVSSLGGKACDALRNPKQLLKTGKSLVTGHIGTAIKDFLGTGAASSASTALGLAAIVTWVYTGARAALHLMGKVVNETAAPQLGSVWFSSTYWRVAAVAALLTLPFLFAAAVQALLRSDVSLLARAVFGHLPLALVGVGVAAPLTMLLLSGTDELCALVWSSSSTNGLTSLLTAGGVARVIGFVDSPFLAFLLCLFTAGAGVLVWFELAMREAAVYIVVLLLPLAFAALVWPARRVWAVRAVELLVALILAKFAIVAVLGLGGAALDHAGAHGLDAMLAGMVLVLLAAFAPWAVLRLVPIAEVASSAAGSLSQHTQAAREAVWATKQMKTADSALTGIASHIANLARSSSDGGRAARPDFAASNGHSRNGAGRGRPAPENWEDDGAPAAGAQSSEAGATAGQSSQEAGVDHSDHPDSVDQSADPGARMDHATPVAQRDHSAPDHADPTPDERVPGADPLWQAPDMSWKPLTLGLDDGWPPEPPWPEDPTRNEPDGASHSDSQPETAPPPTEHNDALPPAQDRGGPL